MLEAATCVQSFVYQRDVLGIELHTKLAHPILNNEINHTSCRNPLLLLLGPKVSSENQLDHLKEHRHCGIKVLPIYGH